MMTQPSCFCHKHPVDTAFVCSICLASMMIMIIISTLHYSLTSARVTFCAKLA